MAIGTSFCNGSRGANVINLAVDSAAEDGEAAFSPGGERIVFYPDRDGGGLYVMGAMGGGVTRVKEEGHHPAWSPDGRFLYFNSDRGGTFNIWRMPVDETAG